MINFLTECKDLPRGWCASATIRSCKQSVCLPLLTSLTFDSHERVLSIFVTLESQILIEHDLHVDSIREHPSIDSYNTDHNITRMGGVKH